LKSDLKDFFIETDHLEGKQIKKLQSENIWKGILAGEGDCFSIAPVPYLSLWKKKEKSFPLAFNFGISVFFNKFNL
jgi:hypothetical protein